MDASTWMILGIFTIGLFTGMASAYVLLSARLRNDYERGYEDAYALHTVYRRRQDAEAVQTTKYIKFLERNFNGNEQG